MKIWSAAKLWLMTFLFLIPELGLAKERRDLSGEYIIVLKKKPAKPQDFKIFDVNINLLRKIETKVKQQGGQIFKTYGSALVGFHAKLTPDLLETLKNDPSIHSIEENGWVEAFDTHSPSLRSWGLDRIDQENLPLDDAYVKPHTFTGSGVHAYIIDSGIRETHEEFVGSIGEGYSPLGEDYPPNEDCNGHGTHVSGTVGGNTSGVAPGVTIHPIRVFKCGGFATFSDIINAMNWVASNHKKPAVANMSLGGSKLEALNVAVRNMTEAGVHVVVAAGNSNNDACTLSPASAPSAITVSASDVHDELASFSSWGPCTDIIAPGVEITSSSISSDTSYVAYNGTSMASPHVAGAVALFLESYPNLSPEELSGLLQEQASKNKILDSKGSPNALLKVSTLGLLPLVSAGENQIVRIPETEWVTLVGKASAAAGNILRAAWVQTSGPELTQSLSNYPNWRVPLKLTNLMVGEYEFRFRAETDLGYSESDSALLIVSEGNLPPKAHAGFDKTVSSKVNFQINGQESKDLDGTLVSYLWEQISGPVTVTFKKPTAEKTQVLGAEPGQYEFSLTVTDNEGGVAQDTVIITKNSPPLVNPGDDQVLVQPTNSTKFHATAEDLDGEIVNYIWKQTHGPSTVSFSAIDSAITDVTGFDKVGRYIFRVKAMDDFGDQISVKLIVDVVAPE